MNILFILEGNEEQAFFDLVYPLINKEVFNVTFLNANGYGKIAPLFQSRLSNDYYDAILCVYDVDNRINDNDSPFVSVRTKLKLILGDDSKVSDVSLCTNPNILQLFLLCCDALSNVALNNTSKEINTSILHKYWNKIGNKKPYDASAWQINEIKNSFEYGIYNFSDLFVNARDLNQDYTSCPGSNLVPAVKAMVDGDQKYFKKAIKAKQLDINK